MTTFRILIDTDNDAFVEPGEIARILRVAAEWSEDALNSDLRDGLALRDINGNTVGRAQMVDAP